ncbi:MAG: ribose-phosphate pyrophosphokinase [Oscillospiraceae bacterium]|jgi:ribose-phosphate pyrophosphokinase|nr:ribose-phosphate pyrophosphokinase [Oscillospiraceae bacterium]
MKYSKLLVMAGNSNLPLANEIVKALGTTLGNTVVKQFADGEVSVSIYDTVRGADVFLIQSTCKPVNDSLMELLILIDACKRASAERITAVIPYFGYARQDRKAKSRDPITAKLVANLLTEAGADRILTIDLHADQIQGFFDIPLDHLLSAGQFVSHCRELMGKTPGEYIVVSPDIGSVKRARNFADKLNLDLAIVEKQRSYTVTNSSHALTVIGNVEGKHALIFDDMCDTAGSLKNAAEICKEKGALSFHAFITHGVLSPPAIENLESSDITTLTLLNTIPYPSGAPICKKVNYLSCADLLSAAIQRIHDEVSLASLF